MCPGIPAWPDKAKPTADDPDEDSTVGRAHGLGACLVGRPWSAETVCHKSRLAVESGLSRPFVSAPYVEEDGRWRPVRVTECPYGEGCRISHHDCRPRKTGPGHPLAVKRCHVHGRYFTVYPPGQVPYGRQRIAPVTSAGLAVGAESVRVDHQGTRPYRWEGRPAFRERVTTNQQEERTAA